MADPFSQNPAGAHYKDPTFLMPMTVVASSLAMYDAAAAINTSDTVAFFTGVAKYGVQDTTNWTLNTYKTIFSHTGKGFIYAMFGCTAGGAETTTFEITIDGVLSEITVTNANTERAILFANGLGQSAAGTDFTTARIWQQNLDTGLDSGTLSTLQTGTVQINTMRMAGTFGVPLLYYNVSCLVRMKHSANITNSTATAYSGVMVRKRIQA